MIETPSPTGDLRRLIATEQRSEAVLAKARYEAEEIVSRAREAAQSADADSAREIERAAEDLRRRLGDERVREERAIEAETKRVTQHYDGIPESVIARLAALVTSRLIG